MTSQGISKKRALVVTTINNPNKVMKLLAYGANERDVPFYVIGDTKTPADFTLDNAQFISVTEQMKKYPGFAGLLPVKHYARKNIGYLIAMEDGCDEIQETDDDNIPRADFWQEYPSEVVVDNVPMAESCAWFNVYALFSDEGLWPRGFPLEYLSTSASHNRLLSPASSRGLILQGLADGNPDVDAVYRLTRTLPVDFKARAPVVLSPGVWCPFNSQNTIFRRAVFPLLYLPSHCSFRMTDIWRSFVAQRCLWEMGEGVVFHSATVCQERNEHSLLNDFSDEVPGYLLNDRIRNILEDCKIDKADLPGAMSTCYEELVKCDIFPRAELPLVYSWCKTIEKFWQA